MTFPLQANVVALQLQEKMIKGLCQIKGQSNLPPPLKLNLPDLYSSIYLDNMHGSSFGFYFFY